MAVDDILVVEWHQSVRGQPAMNVLQYRETEATADPLEAAGNLADGFLNLVAAGFAAVLSEDWRTDAAYVHRISPDVGVPASIVLATAESITGEVASEAVPMGSAVDEGQKIR